MRCFSHYIAAAIYVAVSAFPTLTSADGWDPLLLARQNGKRIINPYPNIPLQCYTKTEGVANPCWACHTSANGLNGTDDWELQAKAEFPSGAKTNHWTNAWPPSDARQAVPSDQDVLSYIRRDNYQDLYLDRRFAGQVKWWPDLNLAAGLQTDGFARDGSGWRAIRYKPFLGTFWATNGNADETYVRLPNAFRTDASGEQSMTFYKANLAILEAAVAVPDSMADGSLGRTVESCDEAAIGVDLDGDGAISGVVDRINKLPEHYVGGASAITIKRYAYPAGTEFLHFVRYIDPDQPDLLSQRVKEVRYSVKDSQRSDDEMRLWYVREKNEAINSPASFPGSPAGGFQNGKGWTFEAFIESESGRLRLQTAEEHAYCLGCHRSLGVTVDDTFSLPRKLPAGAGWQRQSLVGQHDVPQSGIRRPEYLTYLERALAADEYRENAEMITRFFKGGRPIAQSLRRAAPGGSYDLAWMLTPSRQRALQLDRAYIALVSRQQFELGREVQLEAPKNIFSVIGSDNTLLDKHSRVFRDGRLWLDWSKSH